MAKIVKMPDFDLYHTFKKFDWCRLSHTFKASSSCFQLYLFASKNLVTNSDFVAVKAMIENLPAINDAAERALARVTNIHFSPAAPKLHRTKKDLTTVRHSCHHKLKKHMQQQQHEHEQRFNSCHEQILKSFDPLEENCYII